MLFYRCKCGATELHGSYCPAPCDRCPDCGSNLASSSSTHADPAPHAFGAYVVETDEGPKTLTRCVYCKKTRATVEAEAKAQKGGA